MVLEGDIQAAEGPQPRGGGGRGGEKEPRVQGGDPRRGRAGGTGEAGEDGPPGSLHKCGGVGHRGGLGPGGREGGNAH